MTIWLDPVTPKDARVLHAVSLELGEEILWTARRGAGTVRLLRDVLNLKSTVRVVGRHGRTRRDKLVCSTKREVELLDHVSSKEIHLLICYSSVEAARVAFGLGIPIISLHDTPHAHHGVRLQIPLVDHHVCPSVTRRKWEVSPRRRRWFYDGVDEVLWLKPMELWKPRYVLIRMPETRASYFKTPDQAAINGLKERIEDEGLDVKYLERYNGFQDFEPLYAGALAVISVGGTVAREACLRGIHTFIPPSAMGVLPHNYYLRTLGFPIWHLPTTEIVDRIKELKKAPQRSSYADLMDELESPLPLILRLVKRELGKK